MIKSISLVTGASSGLGRVLAELLCEKGHRVYVTARRRHLLERFKNECKDLGGEIVIISGDLADFKFREKLVSTILKKEGKIDYLFNNAGYGRSTEFEKEDFKEMENMFEVNMVAYAHLARLVLPGMIKKNKGRIINVGSVVAFTPLSYFTIYNSTKAAIYSFNRSLRYELKGRNVTTTVVLPTRMKTGFAERAYDCYKEKGRDVCIKEWNKIARSPYIVAKNVIRNMDKGKGVIAPTSLAKILYFARHFEFLVDFLNKNIMGPKELERLRKLAR